MYLKPFGVEKRLLNGLKLMGFPGVKYHSVKYRKAGSELESKLRLVPCGRGWS